MKYRLRTGLQGIALLILMSAIVLLWWDENGQGGRWEERVKSPLLALYAADVQLDRDLLRVTAFQLQQYDPLVADLRRMRGFSEALSRLFATGRTDPEARAQLGEWLERLGQKRELAQRIQSLAAIERNQLRYLGKGIADYHLADGADADQLIGIGYRLYQFTLFDGDLLQEQLLREVEAIRGLGKVPELDLLLHHVERTLGYIGDLHALMAEYNAIDTQGPFDRLSLWVEQRTLARLERVQQRRRWLGWLAVALLALLSWTLWGMERERRMVRHARQRLEGAIEGLDEGFALFDARGRLVLRNRRFDQFYPWLADGSEGDLTLEAFRALQEREGVATENVVQEGAATGTLEQVPQPNGRPRWLLASESRTAQGERVLVRVDVTEAKEHERQLAVLYRALEQSPVSVIITDAEADISYVNPRFESVTGYRKEEVLGRNPRVLKSGLTPDEVYEEMWARLNRGEVWHGELINRRKDGAAYWEEAFIAPVRDIRGNTTHYVAFKDDISERRRTEESLRLHATVFDTLGEGVMIADAEQRILAVNPAFTRITGYSAEEVIGKTPRLLSSGHHDRAFYEQMWKALDETGAWEGEIEDRRKDGECYPSAMSIVVVRNDRGEVAQYIAVFSDISERKTAQRQIEYQANYDALTGLPNRSLFLDRVQHAIHGAHREGRDLALLFVDLDRFKEVNDTLGHLVGDQLLQAVAERLQGCVRESDTVARFGGDEFVILLEHLGREEDSAAVAKKILEALEQPLVLDENELSVGASIGITRYPTDGEDAVTLLRNADMAMYRAKEAGRNTYRYYTSEIDQQIQRRVALTADLRRALPENALFLMYQPIVRIRDRRLAGFEALLRWQHPDEGVLTPNLFIPLAEESGLIGPLGEWVLAEAARQVAQWRAEGRDWRVGVNLSRRQLDLGLDPAQLRKIIEDNGANAWDITLEITEGLMLDSDEDTLRWIEVVRAMGVRFSVDDFGTGYSSLSYLKRYPMTTIKIDRGFVRDLATDPGDASLVAAILGLGESLGLEVVAEGVEDEVQLAFLEGHGCDYAQGYLFGRPMPPGEIPVWLASMSDRIKAG